MSGSEAPPFGIVVATWIESGDPGDEDPNDATKQTAIVEIDVGHTESCFACGNMSDGVARAMRNEIDALTARVDLDEIADVSDRCAMPRAMRGLAHGEEADARLRGLMVTLSLPLVREGRVEVQVEVAPDKWTRIDAVSIEPERITFSYGTNGKALRWSFVIVDGLPAWRTVSLGGKRRFMVEAD